MINEIVLDQAFLDIMYKVDGPQFIVRPYAEAEAEAEATSYIYWATLYEISYNVNTVRLANQTLREQRLSKVCGEHHL